MQKSFAVMIVFGIIYVELKGRPGCGAMDRVLNRIYQSVTLGQRFVILMSLSINVSLDSLDSTNISLVSTKCFQFCSVKAFHVLTTFLWITLKFLYIFNKI